MLTDEELNAALLGSPAPRVTVELMKSRIIRHVFSRLSDTLTHCAIHLDNGYIVTGESACVNPENYDPAIGEKVAYQNAFNKLWPLFGFLLAENQFNKGE